MGIDPITAVLDIGGKVIDRLWPDPATRDAAKLELFKAQQAGELAEAQQTFELAKAQVETNTAEAASQSIFVAGWRPFVGWVCGAGFAMVFVVGPMLEWTANLFGHAIKFPILDAGTLTTLLLGMLGLGTMRTVEKVQGAADTAKLK